WDIGTYEVLEGNYWKGSLSVYLSGKKLKGEWTLKRIESDEGKPKWFVVKTGGKAKAIAKKSESVSALSGRTMEQIAGEKSAVWRSDPANVGGAFGPRQSKQTKSGRKGPSHINRQKTP